MKKNSPVNLGPVPQAILLKAIEDFKLPIVDELPATIVEAELNVVEAEQRLTALKAEIAPREEAAAKRQARRNALEQKAQGELEQNGEISSATSVELDALDKSDKQASIRASEDQVAFETANQNVALQRQFFQKALRKYYLNAPDGPAQKAIRELKETLEILPYALVNLMRIYDHARTNLGWDPHHHPLPVWYGPAGVLLDSLQQMRWPEWPEQIRPWWAPRHGKAPTADDILRDFSRMISDASRKEAA